MCNDLAPNVYLFYYFDFYFLGDYFGFQPLNFNQIIYFFTEKLTKLLNF